MTKKALSYFRVVDPILYSIAQTITLEDHEIRSPNRYFVSLCSEIIGQQLSGKVADVLFDRFEKLFPKRNVTPKRVLATSEETLRTTGMSWSKTRFIRDLARQMVDKSVHLETLSNLSDAEVISELTRVKGIGPWTAEMFLMFSLGREDVFSYGDLGLRNAMKKLYGFKKDPTVKQMEKIVNKWKPYRTYAARILWKSLEQ